MVKMINAVLGNVMWVSEDKVEEYTAAGHKIAAAVDSQPAAPEAKPVKAAKKKTKK